MNVIIQKLIQIITKRNKLINQWNQKLCKEAMFKQNFLCFMISLKAILSNNPKSLIF